MCRSISLLLLAAMALLLVPVSAAQEAPGAGEAAAQPAQVTAPVIEFVEPNLSDINTWTFRPATLTVPAGTTITWVNKGVITHSLLAPGADESPWLMPNDTYQRTFDTPGTIAYACGLHDWMQGTVEVTSADAPPAEAPPAEAPPAPASQAAGYPDY